MLRLFTIANARNKKPIKENGKIIYFNDKQKAKHKRNLLREETGQNLIIIAGPDHRRFKGEV